MFLGIPLGVNLFVANSISVPRFFMDLGPFYTYLVFNENPILLKHLKTQYLASPETYLSNEDNVFLELLQKEKFNEWKKTQRTYKFEKIDIPEIAKTPIIIPNEVKEIIDTHVKEIVQDSQNIELPENKPKVTDI